MKAYKVFDKDMKCRGFQYEIGKEYKIDSKPVVCKQGFHACKKLADCFSYYDFDPQNRVAIVELLGDIDGLDGDKQCTNCIKIIQELKWSEVLELCNTGDCNTGNRNTGNCNTGNRNTGNCNTGNWNTGDRNTGNCNTGNCNTGDRNTGNWNTGDWNTGFFNTDEPFVRMFNKDTEIKTGDLSFPSFLCFETTTWTSHDTATDEEKEIHKKEIEVCGGFFKVIPYKEAFQRAWNKASESDKEKVKKLPNFDADVFFEISGIKI